MRWFPLILLPAALPLAGCADDVPRPAPAAERVTAPVPDPPPSFPAPPVVYRTADPVVPRFAEEPPLPPPSRLLAAGLATVDGGGFTLVTDVPDSGADLPDLLARARPAWDEYFGEVGGDVPMTAFLMAEPDRFRAAGLLPGDLPPFLTGRQRGRHFWMYETDGDYFRRALALHEATHVRMTAGRPAGAKGPLWYLEGVAELFGAHRLADDGALTVRIIPGPEAAAGGWDRIERVRADVAAGYLPGLEGIRAFDDADFLEGRGYAWAWALCAFLDGHPNYRDRFRDVSNPGVRGRLNAAFDAAFADDRRRIAAEWPLFASELVPNYEREPNAVAFADGSPLTAERAVRIDAARGWQSAAVSLAEGDAVEVRADGRFTLADDPRPWESTADGISFDYHRGRRLGGLQAAVLADPPGGPSGLNDPVPVGAAGRFVAPRAGTLYLRLNDRPDRRSENRGGVTVTLAPAE